MAKVKRKEIHYKQIVVTYHQELRTVEFDFLKNKIFTHSDFIVKISDFVEYLGYAKPDFIVVTNKDCGYRISSGLKKYIYNVILDQITVNETQKMFVLSDDPERKLDKYPAKVIYCDLYEDIWSSVRRMQSKPVDRESVY